MDNKLIRGAKVATIGLMVTKAIGILYVIPMNMMLGEEALAIYGVSFLLYATVSQIAIIGFPRGVSKLVAMYRVKGNYSMINRIYKSSVALIFMFSLLIFLVMMFKTDVVLRLYFSEEKLANTDVQGVINSVRLLIPSIVVIPFLSISRGFIEGFEDMMPTSISIIIEQFVRVSIILVGMFLVTRVFKVDDIYAIYAASISSFIGAVFGYLVLIPGLNKYGKIVKKERSSQDHVERRTKVIKMVALISTPFIILSTYKMIFENLNVIFIEKFISDFVDSADYITSTVKIYTINIQKLVVLVLTIASGFTLSVIPSLSSLNEQKQYKELKYRFTQVILLSFFITSFVATFTAVFSEESYYVFFGYSALGSKVFVASVLSAVFYAVYQIIAAGLLSLNKNLAVAISFIIGIVAKIVFTYIVGYTYNYLGFEMAVVPAVSSFIAYICSLTYVLYICNKYDYVNIRTIKNVVIKIFVTVAIVALIIYTLHIFLPTVTDDTTGFVSYMTNAIVIAASGLLTLYLFIKIATKFNYFEYISGTKIQSILSILRRKK